VLFHFKIRNTPTKKTIHQKKKKKATKYSRNSDTEEDKESLNTSKTEEGLKLNTAFNQ